MADLRLVTVSRDGGLHLAVATPKGSIRRIPLTTEQALTIIRDLAGYLRTNVRQDMEEES